jgi:transcription elongation GreA/GreB family factor
MDKREEEKIMSILKDFEKTWQNTKNEELVRAINDLREFGEKLEEKDAHYFEKEKYLELLNQARKIAKDAPKLI